MLPEDFVQKKCNSGKNIQFQPKGFMRIDLEKLAPLLKAEIEVETPSLLIVRVAGTQIDLNASGKTVVKTEDWEHSKGLFLRLLPMLSRAVK